MRRAWITVSTAVVVILALAGTSGAQGPAPGGTPPAQPGQVPLPPPGPTAPVPAPPPSEEEPEVPPEAERPVELERVPEELLETRTPTFVGPDLFNPPAQQGWLNITPSFTLSGEYNDNLFLSSQDKQSDGILGFTPGVTVGVQRRGFRLLAGYNTTGQIFVEESDLNDFGKEQQFFANLFYQVSPRVTFTLSDRFIFGQSSNSLTSSGASVGRQDAWRNTLTPRLRWQATPTTAFNVLASYTTLRFQEDTGDDSDTYRLGLSMDHVLTPRLSGRVAANVAYFDFEDAPHVWTYTPTVGFSYDVTRTLRASVTGGPSIVDVEDDVTIVPAVAVALTQSFKFGTVGLGYDKAVTAETIGISDRHAVFASLDVPTLVRGLRLGFVPRYSIVNTDIGGDEGTDRTLEVLTLNLRAIYQIARNISLIGSYTFYHQSSERSGRSAIELDQNRVFLGVQYAFPINFY
jgi:hypothetical protein